MNQTIDESSVPTWIFVAVGGAFWAVIVGLQIWVLHETVDTGKLLVRLAVENDRIERDVAANGAKIEALQSKSDNHEWRIGAIESRPVRK